VPFPLDKRLALVYELHITNFDAVPLTLKRIEISADKANGEALLSLGGDSLSEAVEQVGSKGVKDPQAIEPGGRAVVFLWIDLQPNHPVPSSLRHRMTFSAASTVAGGTSPPDATLEDFPVPVSRAAAFVLSPPFRGGAWLAGDGPANDSPHRRAILAVDGSIHSPERFAVDWIKVGPNGDSHHDGVTRNENWWGYGEPVLAVADGQITEVVDGIPENTPRVLPTPVTLDNIAGNYVMLRIGRQLYVAYAHLQPGSIQVHLHDRVRRGAILARLGNTGQSTAPHLHFQVTNGSTFLQSEGVPFVLEQFTFLGPGSTYEPDKHPSVAWTHSIPPGNAVLEFRPN
jgi:murein DD-endopeptidase MepM/ murein hydrolase activator NlpD